MNIIIGNKNITLTANKITNPSAVFEKNGQVLYGALLDKKPDYPTLVFDNKYLHSIDITLGSYSHVRYHEAGTQYTPSPWETVQLGNNSQGFVNGVTFNLKVDILQGNYDWVSFQAYIINKYDQSKSIYLAQTWGNGDNWGHGQSFSYTLTQNDMNNLGGPNTELLLKTFMHNDCGDSYLKTRYTFTLTTS